MASLTRSEILAAWDEGKKIESLRFDHKNWTEVDLNSCPAVVMRDIINGPKDYQFRLKKKERIEVHINGHHLPSPIVEPEMGKTYGYLNGIDVGQLVWEDKPIQHRFLNQGLIFATEECAELVQQTLKEIFTGEKDDDSI